ncbi:MAG: helix-turn-helix domain-containing protein [Variovorax sp.]
MEAEISIPIKSADFKLACSNCNLRQLCWPDSLSPEELDRVDSLVTVRKRVARADMLFRSGDAFEAIYAVRVGFFKNTASTSDGRGQVTGFQMAGELLGFDGIGTSRHTCDAVALEDSEVCVIPFTQLETVSRESIGVQRQLHRILSREIVHDHGVMLSLGSMRAEQRLAAFLVNLIERLRVRGFSGSELVLRMTRNEIGSYLGLKLETVSRTFSRFQADGTLDVKQRHLTLLDEPALRRLAGSPC